MLSAPAAAPYAPTANDEKWIPYDIEIPFGLTRSLFLQFKRAEFMKLSSAKERYLTNRSYFRFDLHKSREPDIGYMQHNLMKQLSEDFPDDTYYVAPLFYEWGHLHEAIVTNSLIANTAFLPLQECEFINDEKPHRVIYTDLGDLWQLSDPKHAKWINGVELLREVYASGELTGSRQGPAVTSEAAKDDLRTKLSRIDEILISGVSSQLDIRVDPPETPGRDEDLLVLTRHINFVANVYFGATWIPIRA
jgi:hypothetical protein